MRLLLSVALPLLSAQNESSGLWIELLQLGQRLVEGDASEPDSDRVFLDGGCVARPSTVLR